MERNRRSPHAKTFLSPIPLLCTRPIPHSKGLWKVVYAPEMAFGNQTFVGIHWGGCNSEKARWHISCESEEKSRAFGCLGISRSHWRDTAWQMLVRYKSSSPFQGRDADLGFSLLPPHCWKPNRQLLLWDSTGSCSVLLANNLLADASWYSVVVQWLFTYYVPVWPVTGMHQLHNWEAAIPDLPVRQERCRQRVPAGSVWKRQFGTNSIHLGTGSKQPPKSDTATHRLPCPAGWRGPG